VADAHQFLLEHYKEFDFIWSSPPCQTHSECNKFLHYQGVIRYPDMSLYQEIIFLKQFCKCKWAVENVQGYYEPLIKASKVGRHYIWSNFIVGEFKSREVDIGTFNRHTASKLKQKQASKKSQVERNCCNPNLGLHIFNMAFKDKQEQLVEAFGVKK
jgi:DNA (cytosine-5)-methyltransferase 1